MAKIGLLLCMLCAVAFGGRGMFNGNRIGYGKEKKDRAAAAERLLAIARKDIGLRETTGRNDGERIRQYLAYLGFKEGAPYCAAAVSLWFREAGFSAPRTAWSPAMFPKERVVEWGGSLRASLKTDPRAEKTDHREAKTDDKGAGGLVLGIYFPSLKRIGHVGLVESIKRDFITSIEANTNVIGSREGDGVYRKIRHRRTIYKYADWL